MQNLKTPYFEVTEVIELTGLETEVWDFPIGVPRKDGLSLQVVARNGHSWTGHFAFGEGGASGIWLMPNEKQFCAVSKGNAFIVKAFEPAETNLLQVHCIQSVDYNPSHEVIVLASWDRVCAFDSCGMRWHPEPILGDDLEVLNISDSYMICSGFKHGERLKLTVDLVSGAILKSESCGRV